MDDLKAKFPFIASKLSQFAEDKSWNELVSFSEKFMILRKKMSVFHGK